MHVGHDGLRAGIGTRVGEAGIVKAPKKYRRSRKKQ